MVDISYAQQLLKQGKNQSLLLTNLEGKGAPLVSTDSNEGIKLIVKNAAFPTKLSVS